MSENADIKWYVVHTYSGYENKVRDSLLKAVENNGMQDKIVDVRIPVEEAVEIKNNKRRIVQRKLLPSYVIVKMEMTNETWYVVRNTRGVTGFVGSGNKPTPLSRASWAPATSRPPCRRRTSPPSSMPSPRRASTSWWATACAFSRVCSRTSPAR